MSRRIYTAEDDPVTYRIIGCAIKVHKRLGPGLLETPYQDRMKRALAVEGLSFQSQPRIYFPYARKFRPDFIVKGEVVLELKSVEALLPLHQAQLLTYMRLAGIQRGLLINFNVARLKSGIKRLILSEAPLGASDFD